MPLVSELSFSILCKRCPVPSNGILFREHFPSFLNISRFMMTGLMNTEVLKFPVREQYFHSKTPLIIIASGERQKSSLEISACILNRTFDDSNDLTCPSRNPSRNIHQNPLAASTRTESRNCQLRYFPRFSSDQTSLKRTPKKILNLHCTSLDVLWTGVSVVPDGSESLIRALQRLHCKCIAKLCIAATPLGLLPKRGRRTREESTDT